MNRLRIVSLITIAATLGFLPPGFGQKPAVIGGDKVQVSKLAEIVGVARTDTAQAVRALEGIGLSQPQRASIAALISSPSFQKSSTLITDIHIAELKNTTTVASFIEALRSRVTAIPQSFQTPVVAKSAVPALDLATANQLVAEWSPQSRALSETRRDLLNDPTASGELARMGLARMLFSVGRVCSSQGPSDCAQANETLSDMVLANCQTECSPTMNPLIFEGIDASGVQYSATATRRGTSKALRKASHRIGQIQPEALRKCFQEGTDD